MIFKNKRNDNFVKPVIFYGVRFNFLRKDS